ncbi:MAG TPA: hypothetical protein VJB57_20875 [Dehalococcoidia bacterium]|nr:hypothetical protein [Dehalococcoidia bacterium]
MANAEIPLVPSSSASAPAAEPQFVVLAAPVNGTATHYGESYSGQTMACGGVYVSHDPTIVAISLSRDAEWDCGSYLEVCGALACIKSVRQDICPGCSRNHIDLSEAGISLVCGAGTDLCDVTIQPLQVASPAPAGPPLALPHGY